MAKLWQIHNYVDDMGNISDYVGILSTNFMTKIEHVPKTKNYN
jgi:hypothetical protein